MLQAGIDGGLRAKNLTLISKIESAFKRATGLKPISEMYGFYKLYLSKTSAGVLRVLKLGACGRDNTFVGYASSKSVTEIAK